MVPAVAMQPRNGRGGGRLRRVPGAVRWDFIDPAGRPSVLATSVGSGRPLKVVLDGGNGMAGPMVGPLLDGLGLELIETYWTPDGNFPDHEPNPLLPENRQFAIDKVLATGADLGIAWTGTPTAASSSTTPESSWTATSSPRCWRSRCSSSTRRGDPLRRACLARGARHGEARGGTRMSTVWATPSSRRACARRARCSVARCPGTTTSATSTAPTPARCRRC